MRRENDIIQLLKDNYAKRYGFECWEDFAKEFYFEDTFRILHALDDIALTALRITECKICDGSGNLEIGPPLQPQVGECPICKGTGISPYGLCKFL